MPEEEQKIETNYTPSPEEEKTLLPNEGGVVLEEGKKIISSNYLEDIAGFLLGSDGKINFNEGNINGVDVSNFLSSYLQNIVEDTTPQLGGDLDINSKRVNFPTIGILDCLDEADLASNSASAIATQQSIKAYVDALKFSKLLTFDATQVAIVSNSAEVSLKSVSIPANTLGTGNGIKFSIYVSVCKIDASKSMKLILKYGATDIASIFLVNADAATITGIKGTIEGILFGDGATNAQHGRISGKFVPDRSDGNAATSWPLDMFWGQSFGTGAELSTGALTLDILVDFQQSSVNDAITVEDFLVEIIQK